MTIENIPPGNLVKLPMGQYRWEAWAFLHPTQGFSGEVYVKPCGKEAGIWVFRGVRTWGYGKNDWRIERCASARAAGQFAPKPAHYPAIVAHIHGQLTTYLPAYLNLLA